MEIDQMPLACRLYQVKRIDGILLHGSKLLCGAAGPCCDIPLAARRECGAYCESERRTGNGRGRDHCLVNPQ
jgi:hypothetical protein